ncbi:MAG: hypothetical protein AAFN59_12055 [Pseudomonadota bacterium]
MINRLKRFAGGGGTLTILSVIFVASAGLRITGDNGWAIAQVTDQSAVVPTLETGGAPMCEKEPGVAEALAAILERERRVADREERLDIRVQALALVEEEVEADLERLAQAEASLRDTLTFADSAAESDLARLTSVYENMKPVEASALFSQMSPDFAAGFLGRMRPDAAASIMSGLEPELAYAISVVLAGRNASAPVRLQDNTDS